MTCLTYNASFIFQNKWPVLTAIPPPEMAHFKYQKRPFCDHRKGVPFYFLSDWGFHLDYDVFNSVRSIQFSPSTTALRERDFWNSYSFWAGAFLKTVQGHKTSSSRTSPRPGESWERGTSEASTDDPLAPSRKLPPGIALRCCQMSRADLFSFVFRCKGV